MLVQSTLHVMPAIESVGELVCRGLSLTPGVRSMAVCIGGKTVATAGELDPPADGSARDPCPIGGTCWHAPGDGDPMIALHTLNRHHGCLVFALDGSGEFATYEPYVRNTANTLATTLENREQRGRLEELNRDLRDQVARKERAEAALLDTQRGLEHAVAERTLDLLRVNDALAAEIGARKLAQETSAWEAALNGAVARLARAMMQADTLGEVAGLVLEHALRLTDSRSGCVGHIDPASGDMVCPALIGEIWRSSRGEAGHDEILAQSGPWGWLVRRRESFLSNDRSQLATLGIAPAVRRLIAAPALGGGVIVGQIALGDASREYTTRDAELLQHLAELYAMAIDRHRQGEERSRLEAQVQHAQKLESVGVLAGGVAHDFRNLLQIIRAYVDLILRHADERSPLRPYVLELARAVDRGADITGQLLAFSRKAEITIRRIEVNELVKDVARMLEHTLPKTIQVALRLAPDAGFVDADSGQLAQVLVNLAVNSRDAMPDGGVLEVATERTRPELVGPAARSAIGDADCVCLRVRDTGEGMDEQTVRRAFDPFFTTKEAARGTGLGLSVAYGIVRAHRGHIQCASAPGQGSTFTVVLPAAGESAPAQAGAAATAAPVAGNETILLVDDEAAIVRAVRTVLAANGYRVITAASGEEALAIYGRRDPEIDVVVMDLGLPGAGGEQSLREIRRLDPAARIVVSSGSIWPSWSESGAMASLIKPYPLATLLTTLRRVLAMPHPGAAGH